MKITTVEFYGDKLQVVGETLEDGVLLLKAACEAIGLDYSAQLKRLKSEPWAGVAMVATPDARGCLQETATIPIKKVPMWFATIDASRLASEQARVKLVRYQCEAADVLAQHFLGTPRANPTAGPDPRILEAHLLSESMKNWAAFYDRLGLLDTRRQYALADMGELAFRRGQRALGGGVERKLLPPVGSKVSPGVVAEEDRTTAELMSEAGVDPVDTSDWASSAGRWLAETCREHYGDTWHFDKTLQRIDNIGRPVNVFAAKDLPMLRESLDRYLLTLPARKAKRDADKARAKARKP